MIRSSNSGFASIPAAAAAEGEDKWNNKEAVLYKWDR